MGCGASVTSISTNDDASKKLEIDIKEKHQAHSITMEHGDLERTESTDQNSQVVNLPDRNFSRSPTTNIDNDFGLVEDVKEHHSLKDNEILNINEQNNMNENDRLLPQTNISPESKIECSSNNLPINPFDNLTTNNDKDKITDDCNNKLCVKNQKIIDEIKINENKLNLKDEIGSEINQNIKNKSLDISGRSSKNSSVGGIIYKPTRASSEETTKENNQTNEFLDEITKEVEYSENIDVQEAKYKQASNNSHGNVLITNFNQDDILDKVANLIIQGTGDSAYLINVNKYPSKIDTVIHENDENFPNIIGNINDKIHLKSITNNENNTGQVTILDTVVESLTKNDDTHLVNSTVEYLSTTINMKPEVDFTNDEVDTKIQNNNSPNLNEVFCDNISTKSNIGSGRLSVNSTKSENVYNKNKSSRSQNESRCSNKCIKSKLSESRTMSRNSTASKKTSNLNKSNLSSGRNSICSNNSNKSNHLNKSRLSIKNNNSCIDQVNDGQLINSSSIDNLNNLNHFDTFPEYSKNVEKNEQICLKTAEVNRSKTENMLINMSSSPINYNSNQSNTTYEDYQDDNQLNVSNHLIEVSSTENKHIKEFVDCNHDLPTKSFNTEE